MKMFNETKRPLWRRAILALLIIAAPLATSSVASAGDPIDYEYDASIRFECGRSGPYVTVNIDDDGDSEAEFTVELFIDGNSEDSVEGTADDLNGERLFADDIEPGKEHEVEVTGDGEFYESAISYFLCDGLKLDCSEPDDLEVRVTFPDLEGDWEFTAFLLEDDSDDSSDALDEVDGEEGETKRLNAPSEGTYYVLIVRTEIVDISTTADEEFESLFRVRVRCGEPADLPGFQFPGSFYNFNIPKLATPTTAPAATTPLPVTGGSSNSAVVVAPIAILLGAALIMVRRRLATA